MKKLFAILTVALFATTFAYSATYNVTPFPASGSYSAAVFCTPTISGGTNVNLQNYFVSATPVAVNVATPQVFVLHGPPQATYKLTWDGTNPLLAHNAYLNTGGTAGAGTATLAGTWSGTCGDGDFNTDYNASTGVYNPEGDPADIGCANEQPAITLTFTPATITPTVAGTATFSVNVFVTATI